MYDKIVMKNQSAPSINFTQTKKITKASLKVSSPYPTIRASFNWLNVDFPYPHTHTHWEIFIILKGKLKHTINGVQEIGSKGYACIIRPNDYHYLEYVDNDGVFHALVSMLYTSKSPSNDNVRYLPPNMIKRLLWIIPLCPKRASGPTVNVVGFCQESLLKLNSHTMFLVVLLTKPPHITQSEPCCVKINCSLLSGKSFKG